MALRATILCSVLFVAAAVPPSCVEDGPRDNQLCDGAAFASTGGEQLTLEECACFCSSYATSAWSKDFLYVFRDPRYVCSCCTSGTKELTGYDAKGYTIDDLSECGCPTAEPSTQPSGQPSGQPSDTPSGQPCFAARKAKLREAVAHDTDASR